MMPTRGSAPMSSARGVSSKPRRATIRLLVTASGQFSYRTANIGIGYNHAPLLTPSSPGQDLPHPGLDGKRRAPTAFASLTTTPATACSSGGNITTVNPF